jgi:flagellin-specific chaperone FliS
MNPYLKYKQASSLSWTRVDMLLLVYDQAVAALNEGTLLLEQGRTSELMPVSLRAARTLLMIADGLDLQKGELPVQVLRLVVYALDQIRTNTPKNWRSASAVIGQLRDGFLEIQDRARNDEYEGRIPALDAVG